MKLAVSAIALSLGLGFSLAAAAQDAAQASAVQAQAGEQQIHKSWGAAIHGEPKHGPEMEHFPWVNPDAPKGGTFRTATTGTFDSFNPYIAKGDPLNPGYETLMEQSIDEPSTSYCLICETIEYPEDRSWVAFNLRPEARWHDGQPITAEDVAFSFRTLTEKGAPFYRQYYENVADVVVEGPQRVKFAMKTAGNNEMPNIMGDLPVIPKHYWEAREFDAITLEVPLVSGPYKIASFEPGRTVVTERVEDYWGKDLPMNRGRYNFDRFVTEYYRDRTVAREAFKAGQADYWFENSSKDWATSFDVPAVREGLIQKVELEHDRPRGLQAFWFNTRKDKFQDPRVREALGYLFDFEWTNKNIFYDAYERSRSYFSGDLSASGLPEGEELAILEDLRERYPDLVPARVFTDAYEPPVAPGTGDIRENMRKALALFREAGYRLENGKLVNEKGEQLTIEFLEQANDPTYERYILPYIRNMEKMGIAASIRPVDDSQYINRVRGFDYDIITQPVGQSESPGNEQRDYWGSEAADEEGSRNIAGVKNAAIDDLIEQLVQTKDQEKLHAQVRALDRLLQWSFYVVPQWHIDHDRVLYWDKFGRPEQRPLYGEAAAIADAWWVVPEKAQALADRLASVQKQ